MTVPPPPGCWACAMGARHSPDVCTEWAREAAVDALPDLPSDARDKLYEATEARLGDAWARLPSSARQQAVAQLWLESAA